MFWQYTSGYHVLYLVFWQWYTSGYHVLYLVSIVKGNLELTACLYDPVNL